MLIRCVNMCGHHYFISSLETSSCEKHCALSTLSFWLWVVLELLFRTLCLTNPICWETDSLCEHVWTTSHIKFWDKQLWEKLHSFESSFVSVGDLELLFRILSVLNKHYLLRCWFVVWTCVDNIILYQIRQASSCEKHCALSTLSLWLWVVFKLIIPTTLWSYQQTLASYQQT